VLWDVIRGNEPGDLLDGLSKSTKASAEVAEVPVHHFRYVEQKLHDVQTLTAGRCHKLCTCFVWEVNNCRLTVLCAFLS